MAVSRPFSNTSVFSREGANDFYQRHRNWDRNLESSDYYERHAAGPQKEFQYKESKCLTIVRSIRCLWLPALPSQPVRHKRHRPICSMFHLHLMQRQHLYRSSGLATRSRTTCPGFVDRYAEALSAATGQTVEVKNLSDKSSTARMVSALPATCSRRLHSPLGPGQRGDRACPDRPWFCSAYSVITL